MRMKSLAAIHVMAAAPIIAAVLIGLALPQRALPAEVYGPADPVQKDANRFDSKRPIRQEIQTGVPDGFTVGAVGIVRAAVTAR